MRCLFIIDRIHSYDVRCWTFDVRRSSVSFPIRLSPFSGQAVLVFELWYTFIPFFIGKRFAGRCFAGREYFIEIHSPDDIGNHKRIIFPEKHENNLGAGDDKRRIKENSKKNLKRGNTP